MQTHDGFRSQNIACVECRRRQWRQLHKGHEPGHLPGHEPCHAPDQEARHEPQDRKPDTSPGTRAPGRETSATITESREPTQRWEITQPATANVDKGLSELAKKKVTRSRDLAIHVGPDKGRLKVRSLNSGRRGSVAFKVFMSVSEKQLDWSELEL